MAVAVALVAVTALLCWLLMVRVRARRFERLSALVSRGDEEGFLALRDANVSRAVLSPYARELLTLRMLARRGDDRALRDQVNTLMKMRLRPSERAQVLDVAFEAFARRGSAARCGRILKDMEKSMGKEASARYLLFYDVALLGDAGHREELEKSLERLEGSPAKRTRGYVEYLLSKTYAAVGETSRAQEMRRRAARDYAVDEKDLEGSVDVAAYV